VTSAVITNSGHWIMEEQPAQAVKVITAFIEGKQPVANH
jgi:pimeloyl-ACP methyl ester carboxylesterase